MPSDTLSSCRQQIAEQSKRARALVRRPNKKVRAVELLKSARRNLMVPVAEFGYVEEYIGKLAEDRGKDFHCMLRVSGNSQHVHQKN